MQKICHLSSAHSTYDIRIFHKECKSLTQKYEVHLVVQGEKDELLDGVQIHHITKSNKGRLNRMTSGVYQVYQRALEVEAALYHFHDPELIPVGFLLKLKGKKVIYDIHEDVPKQIMSKEWIAKPLRRIVAGLMRFAENMCNIFFDGIISVTPEICSKFKNVECIYNNPIIETLDRNQVRLNDGFTCCYAGGITKIRGIEEMIEASKGADINLLLAGSFENDIVKNFVEANLSEKILYEGFLNRERMKDFYSKSDCGLVVLYPEPNYIKSQPIKMKEYMEAGIPFVASNFPDWVKFVEKYQCGICVDPLNVEQIVEAMLYLKNNPDKAKKMGMNGRNTVEENFSWKNEENKLLRFYENII